MRRFRALFLLSLSIVVLDAAFFAFAHRSTVRAATPASGTLSLTSLPLQWDGFALPATSPNESTCVEGVNCDTFTFTLAPGDYTGKRVRFRITWTNQFNDYDVFAHAGSNAGAEVQSSGDGAPETVEENTFDINRVVSAGVNDTFTIHTVYFAVATIDPYHGVVSLEDISSVNVRTAKHVVGNKSGLRFSRNRTVWATGAGSNAEPSVRVDFQGNGYVGAPRGLTGGTDLWRFDLNPLSPTYDPFLRAATATFDAGGNPTNPAWKGQPDAIMIADDSATLGGDGGGDYDMAVGFSLAGGVLPGAAPTLAMSSLVAANISVQNSADRGDTILRNPAGNILVPEDDREWQEFLGSSVVYMGYRELAGLQSSAKFYVNRSDDGGLTYGPAVLAAVGGNTTGDVTVDQRDGTVYFCFQGPGANGNKEVHVAVGTPPNLLVPPVTYTVVTAATGQNSIANLFPACKVADDGTLYVTYSDGGTGIVLAHSFDHGKTWAPPVRVDEHREPAVKLMPWLATGKQPGSVAVVWLAAEGPDSEDGLGQNNNNSNWKVWMAQSINATMSMPTFYQNVASDHFIHGSNVSVAGLVLSGESPNRNLLDFIQLALDPQGLALVAYGDDHNDFRGQTFVAHQLSGYNLNTGKRVDIKDTDPGDAVNTADPEVKDWRHDARAETRPPILPDIDTPADIVSIDYGCTTIGGLPAISATLRASGLESVPPLGVWRMSFASNPTKPGVSDRADQWFLIAETDDAGNRTFSYGTAARNTDGSITYTKQGAADVGRFDLATRSVTMSVLTAKLNALQTHGTITDKTKFIGLRGFASVDNFVIPVNTPAASTSVATGITDATRGGTTFSCK
ncbi:MAG TPA: hypothetical protein VGQ11_03715 [Candidatus Acidoferrales bacterium]|nr:hypothetical protein [Candidatus Acidoferrales bacterium]